MDLRFNKGPGMISGIKNSNNYSGGGKRNFYQGTPQEEILPDAPPMMMEDETILLPVAPPINFHDIPIIQDYSPEQGA